jgi:hypothetical protein
MVRRQAKAPPQGRGGARCHSHKSAYERQEADAFSIGPRPALLLGDKGAVIWTVVTGYQCVSIYAVAATMKASQIIESTSTRSLSRMASSPAAPQLPGVPSCGFDSCVVQELAGSRKLPAARPALHVAIIRDTAVAE